MNRRLVAVAALGIAAVLSLSLRATAEDKSPARAAFERMKKQAGDWIKTKDKDKADAKVALSTKVVSMGSTIVETLAPGQPHEMVTVYFMDGENLVCTHYCGHKNQPRMKAVAPFDGKTLSFKFDGGTNVNPEKDQYMGDLDITFVSDDELKEVWTSYTGKKKDADQMVFEYTRKK